MTKLNNYDANFYNRRRALNRNKYFDSKPLFNKKGIDTNKLFFDYILNEIKKKQAKKISVLDLGTGTGYVPTVLSKLTNANLEIIGIDLSSDMIKIAKKNNKNTKVVYKIADNCQLPFKNEKFDIITNKLVTQFDFKEVYRVLKKGGIFIFKEYGRFKGFKEICNIFGNRFIISRRSPNDYLKQIEQMGYEELFIQKFLIKRKYKLKELNNIFLMANLINDYRPKDLQKIQINLCRKKNIVDVTSDPFIIFMRK